jgi:hypothetical protein
VVRNGIASQAKPITVSVTVPYTDNGTVKCVPTHSVVLTFPVAAAVTKLQSMVRGYQSRTIKSQSARAYALFLEKACVRYGPANQAVKRITKRRKLIAKRPLFTSSKYKDFPVTVAAVNQVVTRCAEVVDVYTAKMKEFAALRDKGMPLSPPGVAAKSARMACPVSTPASTAQFDSGGKGGTPMDEGPEELDPEYQELLRAQGKQKIAAALEKETKQGKKATVGKMASIVGNNAKVRCPPPLPLLSLPAPCLPTLTPLSV